MVFRKFLNRFISFSAALIFMFANTSSLNFLLAEAYAGGGAAKPGQVFRSEPFYSAKTRTTEEPFDKLFSTDSNKIKSCVRLLSGKNVGDRTNNKFELISNMPSELMERNYDGGSSPVILFENITVGSSEINVLGIKTSGTTTLGAYLVILAYNESDDTVYFFREALIPTTGPKNPTVGSYTGDAEAGFNYKLNLRDLKLPKNSNLPDGKYKCAVWAEMHDEGTLCCQAASAKIFQFVIDTAAPVIKLEKNVLEYGLETTGITEEDILAAAGVSTDDSSPIEIVEITDERDSSVVENLEDIFKKIGTYSIKLSATDEASNISESAIITIIIKDTTAPVISVQKSTLEYEIRSVKTKADILNDAGASTDDSSPIEIADFDNINFEKIGSYKIHLTAEDEESNISEKKLIEVRIIEKNVSEEEIETFKSDSSEVVIKAPKGLFPAGSKVQTRVLMKNGTEWNQIYSQLDDIHKRSLERISFYEIKMIDSGSKEIDLSGNTIQFEMCILIPDGYDKNELSAINVKPGADEAKTCTIWRNPENNKDYSVWKTTHCSWYGLSDPYTANDLWESSKYPTGDSLSNWFIVSSLFICAFIIFIIKRNRKKFSV